MHRRGHLSTKIANVKLRPAPASTGGRDRKSPSPMNAMDEEMLRRAWEGAEDEETSTAGLRSSSRPWQGIVITFTGVEDKPRLSDMATKLGAEVESALTISVSHVVASGFGSAKYLYAVEHRLPVMAPSWIDDAHRRWLQAEEFDVTAHMQAHKLQPFIGLKIAMSGIEPIERRRQLVHYITTNGGIYSKDLDRTCTHLVSDKPTNIRNPSEKVKWAVKELAARDARRRAGKKVEDEDMKIVYEEWVWDCVAYEGRWKEDYYDAAKVRRSGRASAEDVLNGTVHREELKASRRAEEADEPAVLKKRKKENLDSLVGELISMASIKVEPSTDRVLDVHADVMPEVTTTEEPVAPAPTSRLIRREPELRKTSLLHASRTTSFTGSSKPTGSPFELDPSLPLTAVPKSIKNEPTNTLPQIFEGLRFSHVIEEKCEGLERALEIHGGKLVREADRSRGEEVDYVVVRLCSTNRPILGDTGKQPLVVTECWIEGCCYEQRLISLDSHLVFKPLVAQMPISGADKMLVHLSGFSSENAVYMRRLLRVIGATLSLKLSKQTTHLVCAQPAGQKYDKALEWGVSVVRDSWLLAMGQSGQLEPEDDHRHSKESIPAPTGRTPLLGDNASSFRNVSGLIELSEPVDHRRTQVPSQNAPKPFPLPSSVSPSRALKPTPTHVDMEESGSIGNLGSGSHNPTHVYAPAQPLSPPKAETERRLNNAHSPRKRNAGSPPESIESKLSRLSSAPTQEAAARIRPNTGKAVTVMGIGGTEGRTEMTEVLRQLAQKDDSATRSKAIRRSRPSSRLRASNVHHVSCSNGSPASTSAVDPDAFADRTRLSSPTSPDEEPTAMDGDGNEVGGYEEAEESLRVNYFDPNAEKEKRRLVEALRRSQAGEIAPKRARR